MSDLDVPPGLSDRMARLAASASPQARAQTLLGRRLRRRRRVRVGAAGVAVGLAVALGAVATARWGDAGDVRPTVPVASDPVPTGAPTGAPSAGTTLAQPDPSLWLTVYRSLQPPRGDDQLPVPTSVRFADGGGRAAFETISMRAGISIERLTSSPTVACAARVVAGSGCVARADGAVVDAWEADGSAFPGYAPLHPDDVTGLTPRPGDEVRGISWYRPDGWVVTVVSSWRPLYRAVALSAAELEAIASSDAWFS